LGKLGIAYHALGQAERAIEYHQQALAIARDIGDRRNEGIQLGTLGEAYCTLGQVERAIEYHQQALAIAREIRDRRNEGAWLSGLGLTYHALGQVERAIEYHQQALAIAREIRDPRNEADPSWYLGLLYEESDPARAVALMSVRVAYEREIGHRDAEAHAERVDQIRAKLPSAKPETKTDRGESP
jgi:tetratricopeptide (TPR) repeat protein